MEVNHYITIDSSGIYILNIIMSYYMTGLMSTVWFTTITDETASVLIIYAKQIPTFQQYEALLSLREQWVKGRRWQLNCMVAPFITLYHLIV